MVNKDSLSSIEDNQTSSLSSKPNLLFTGYYVSDDWGMSFIVPGLLIAGCGLLVWLFMIAKPEDIGIELEATESPEASSDSDNPGIVSHNFLHVCPRVLPS